MTLPDAARFSGAFAGSYAGFSVPGMEVYEHDCRTGEICPECIVDEGDTCRPRWVNRQDHGFLTRVNIARADHPNAPYGGPGGCLDGRNFACTVSELRTTAYPSSLYEECEDEYPEDAIAGARSTYRRRYLAEKMRQGAASRAAARNQAAAQAVQHVRAVAGQMVEETPRKRHAWGNHNNHTKDAVGIRYIPMAGDDPPTHIGSMQGDFDCLIVAPGHVRCDFYESNS